MWKYIVGGIGQGGRFIPISEHKHESEAIEVALGYDWDSLLHAFGVGYSIIALPV